QPVGRVGRNRGVTNAVVKNKGTATFGDDRSAVLRDTVIAGAAKRRGCVKTVVYVIVEGVHFVGYLGDVIGLGLDVRGGCAVGGAARAAGAVLFCTGDDQARW